MMNDANDGYSAVQTGKGGAFPPPKPKAKPKSKTRRKDVLNEDKPFGTVHGGQGKAKYFQDGQYFDGKGNLCEPVE